MGLEGLWDGADIQTVDLSALAFMVDHCPLSASSAALGSQRVHTHAYLYK